MVCACCRVTGPANKLAVAITAMHNNDILLMSFNKKENKFLDIRGKDRYFFPNNSKKLPKKNYILFITPHFRATAP